MADHPEPGIAHALFSPAANVSFGSHLVRKTMWRSVCSRQSECADAVFRPGDDGRRFLVDNRRGDRRTTERARRVAAETKGWMMLIPPPGGELFRIALPAEPTSRRTPVVVGLAAATLPSQDTSLPVDATTICWC